MIPDDVRAKASYGVPCRGQPCNCVRCGARDKALSVAESHYEPLLQAAEKRAKVLESEVASWKATAEELEQLCDKRKLNVILQRRHQV